MPRRRRRLASLLGPLVGTALATVGTVSNISDHSSSVYFAKVDSNGRLAVGDGSGPLSVDGTVASRPAAPAFPWSASADIQNGSGGSFIAGPSALPINVTSLSVSTDQQGGEGVNVYLSAYQVPSSASSCSGGTIVATIWHIRDTGDCVTPLSFSFPAPLQLKPPANTKVCLEAQANTLSTTTMNAVGFYGG